MITCFAWDIFIFQEACLVYFEDNMTPSVSWWRIMVNHQWHNVRRRWLWAEEQELDNPPRFQIPHSPLFRRDGRLACTQLEAKTVLEAETEKSIRRTIARKDLGTSYCNNVALMARFSHRHWSHTFWTQCVTPFCISFNVGIMAGVSRQSPILGTHFFLVHASEPSTHPSILTHTEIVLIYIYMQHHGLYRYTGTWPM